MLYLSFFLLCFHSFSSICFAHYLLLRVILLGLGLGSVSFFLVKAWEPHCGFPLIRFLPRNPPVLINEPNPTSPNSGGEDGLRSGSKNNHYRVNHGCGTVARCACHKDLRGFINYPRRGCECVGVNFTTSAPGARDKCFSCFPPSPTKTCLHSLWNARLFYNYE